MCRLAATGEYILEILLDYSSRDCDHMLVIAYFFSVSLFFFVFLFTKSILFIYLFIYVDEKTAV